MIALDSVLYHPFIFALGWTLLHFLWQGAVVALLFAAARTALRKSASNTRYLAGCAALLLLSACPVATFSYLASPKAPPVIPMLSASASVRETIVSTPREATQLTALSTPNLGTSGRDQLAARVQKILPWVVSGWLGSVVLLSLRLLLGYARVRRIKTQAHESLGEFWETKLRRLAEQVRVSRPVRLCQSALVEVPTVIGWLRPVILFPASAVAGLSPAQLEAILAHELAHIRRHDYLVNLLQNVVETFLFYHPAVWWVSRQVSQERELCCDDLTVKVCCDRIAYAKALATLEELRGRGREPALAADGGALLQRIRRLLGMPGEPNRSGWWLAGTLVLVAVATLVVVSRSSLFAADADGVLKIQNPQSRPARSALEFRLVANDGDTVPADELAEPNNPNENAPKLRVLKEVLLDGRAIEAAGVQASPFAGRTEIGVTLTDAGAQAFKRLTEQNISRRLAIVFAGHVLSAPQIHERIMGKQFVITGDFTKTDAEAIVAALNVDPASVGATSQASASDVTASTLVHDARRLAATGQLAEAEAKLTEAASPDPAQAAATNSIASSHTAMSMLIQDARLLIELGKLSEAEAKLEQASSQEPDHPAAKYYLEVIKETRRAQEARQSEIPSNDKVRYPIRRDKLPQPNPFARTNVIHTSPARERIYQKLDSIILDEVIYDSVPLSEVVRDLSERARTISPPGVNFISSSSPVEAPTSSPEKESPSERGPSSAGRVPPGGTDLNKAIIRIGPPLRNVRLGDVIEAITKAADQPLKHSVEDYAIIFTSRASEPPQLFTRTFKVDPSTFIKNLSKVLDRPDLLGPQDAATNSLNEAVRTFFAWAGVDLMAGAGSGGGIPIQPTSPASVPTPGDKAVFFNDRTGILFARATPEDLDIIEQALQVLNWTPPQVEIDLKLVELSDAEANALGLDRFLNHTLIGSGDQARPQASFGTTSTNTPPASRLQNDRLSRKTNAAMASVTAVLTESQFRSVLRALEQRAGVDVLASPKVTTLSGRQAKVAVTQLRTIVRGLAKDVSKGDSQPAYTYKTGVVPVGPSVDVIPHVLEGTRSIHMTIIASVTEFLGYDDPGSVLPKAQSNASNALGGPLTATLPLPRFQIRHATSAAAILDGQTIAVSGFLARETRNPDDKVPVLGDIPLLGRLFRSEAHSKTNKHLILFVTPTIVDPAGNRVHAPEQ